jgi:GST-like protein
MIDLYFWTTPNGYKITMFLEEAKVPYNLIGVNISTGEQFDPEFLKIAPNNRIPAMVDHDPADGGEPIPVFESGAMLLYLADKTGKFIPSDLRGRTRTIQWLFWQMGGLGPMAGQNHHFVKYAPERIPYAMERYVNETGRLYAVVNKQLASNEYVAGDSYTIADMAIYPWIVPHENQQQDLDNFPHLKRWFEAIAARPGTVAAYARKKDVNPDDTPSVTEESRKLLFGQSATTVR